MAAGSEGVLAVVGTGRPRLGWVEEKGGRGSDGLGVGVGLRIERGPGQRGEVEGSKLVEWSRAEWSGEEEQPPPRRTTGRKHGRGGTA